MAPVLDIAVLAACALALVAPYLLYPLVLKFAIRPRRRPTNGSLSSLPTVSVLIPAHNEAARIADKLRNAMNLRYPAKHLEILVASDGSDDRTAEIARGFESDNLRVVELEERGGKLAALSRLLELARGELVLFTDVGAHLPSNVIAELVTDFADPAVVVAMPRYACVGASDAAPVEDTYWNRETRLKALEAERDMLLGAHGACYLMRKDAIRRIPPDTIHDDFLWPLLARAEGGRVVYRHDLAVTDEPPSRLSTVFERTARMAQGNLQILWRQRRLLTPKHARIAVSLIGHKLFKTLGPLWIVAMAAWTNVRALTVPELVLVAIAGDSLLVGLAMATTWQSSGRALPKVLGFMVHAFVAQVACAAGILRFALQSNATRWSRPAENDVPALHRPALPPRSVRVAKRTLDIVGGSVGILVALPLMPFIALAIIVDSPGPVFYRQARVAKDAFGNEHHFLIWKFRSMRVDAESDGNPVWATERDPRVTAVGAFLRKARFDEIPQLFQVLLGEMTLVGPRPERPSISDHLSYQLPGYDDRLTVCKPGITGWAQVHTGYDTSVESVREKLLYDFAYNAHLYGLRSYLAMEMRVIALTLAVVLYGRGAR